MTPTPTPSPESVLMRLAEDGLNWPEAAVIIVAILVIGFVCWTFLRGMLW